MRTRKNWSRRAVIGLSLSALSACYEEGPLTPLWTEDTQSPPDTQGPQPSDTTDGPGPEDTQSPNDLIEPEDTHSPGDADGHDDTSSGVSCTQQSHCDSLNTNRCEAPYVCGSNYECVPQAGWEPCAPSSDPCLPNQCDPATGQCRQENICTCEAESLLRCGESLHWYPNEAPRRPHFVDLSCGPQAGALDPTLVKVQGRGRSLMTFRGVESAHLLDAAVCSGSAGCIAGGTSTIQHTFSGQGEQVLSVVGMAEFALAEVSLTCDITQEISCSDGLDEDGDGLTDCADRDCNGRDGCPFIPDTETGLCGNGLDDDQDGLTDCADSDCRGDARCVQACPEIRSTFGCSSTGTNVTLSESNPSRLTNYGCHNVPMFGAEGGHRFTGGTTPEHMRISFISQSAPDMRMHIIREQEGVCEAALCEAWVPVNTTHDLMIAPREVVYLLFDTPQPGNSSYSLVVSCP